MDKAIIGLLCLATTFQAWLWCRQHKINRCVLESTQGDFEDVKLRLRDLELHCDGLHDQISDLKAKEARQ